MSACTSLTDDSQVFAVIGTMYDPTGDAQLCLSKQHKTVLITDGLSQEMLDKAPPGLLLTPGITADRRLKVIMSLLKSRHTLDGKKVAVLTETTATARVDAVVDPALDEMGVAGLEGRAVDQRRRHHRRPGAARQLHREVEDRARQRADPRRRGRVVEAVRREDQGRDPRHAARRRHDRRARGGQDDVKANVVPNPYDGIITAEGRIGLEHSETPNYTYCREIFEKQTGIKIPLPNVVVKLPNGQENDIYGNAEDACRTSRCSRTSPDASART